MLSDKNILDEFTANFCAIVEKHCKYVVVSGFFAISSGRSRGTEDIDIIIEKLTFDTFRELHVNLKQKGFDCIQTHDIKEIYDYLKDKLSVRYIYRHKDLPNMELKMARDKLDEIQIKNRKKYGLTGQDLWFAEIEMFLAFKEELLKSKKDIEDATHIREVYSDEINKSKINKYKELIQRYRL